MIQLDSIDYLLDFGLVGADLKCLLLIISRCTWANKAYCERKVLAERLGISTQNLWKSLTKLRKCGAIYFDPRSRADITISPFLCWRGAPADRHAAFLAYQRLFDGELLPVGKHLALVSNSSRSSL